MINISISRKWVLLMSVFVLLLSVLLSGGIYTQQDNNKKLEMLISQLHQHHLESEYKHVELLNNDFAVKKELDIKTAKQHEHP